MFPLFETIKITDGQPAHLEWHQKRIEYAFKQYYGKKAAFNLSEIITIPQKHRTGIIRSRFLYNDADYEWAFTQYHYKSIASLRVIRDDSIEYDLKFSDRSHLSSSYNQRGTCDDILIIKNDRVTDTSYCNIVFYDGKYWITPDSPLLKGTCRARLLDHKIIVASEIRENQIHKFKSFKLINSLRDFIQEPEVPVDHIQM